MSIPTVAIGPAGASVIQRLVDLWLEGPDPHRLADVVRTNSALPVYGDLGGTLFLRTDGEVLVQGSNEAIGSVNVDVEHDPGWRLIALTEGARKYPELAALLPPRAAQAEDCATCSGRGRVSIGDMKEVALCGGCYGLGWQDAAA